MLKQFLPRDFAEIYYFFKDLVNRNPIYPKLFISTILLCLLPAVLTFFGIEFGITYDLKQLYLLRNETNEDEIFKVLDRLEKGNFFHTILETICVIIAIFTVVFAFIIYEVQKNLITVVIAITLFCAGILDAFHILASDQLIWSPGQTDVTVFTWLISRIFNAGIILVSSIIILSENNVFDRIAERSVYQLAFLFILVTFLTITIVFFNVTHLPNITLEGKLITRPLELIPLVIFLINLIIILPFFYKKRPSIFSFALLISMIPAAATQMYISVSVERFDSNFILSHLMKLFSYLIPFIGILVDYLDTYKKQNSLIEQLNIETKEKTKAKSVLSGVLDSSIDSIIALKSIRNENNQIIDFEFVLVNDAVQKFTGFAKDEFLGRRFLQTDALGQEDLFERYVTVAETGKTAAIEHKTLKEGNETWLSIVAVRLNDGVAITFKDVTSAKEAQEEIIHYQKELENKVAELNRSNTELEQFAYIASHDLQEPLRKIQAFGDRLAIKYSDNLKDEGKDYLSRMKNAASRMQILINDLLNFSRVKRTNNKIEKIHLNSLVNEVLADLETRITQLKATLKVESLPEIEGDKRQLGQLFQNLISNALKFHKPGINPEIALNYKKLSSSELSEKYNIFSNRIYFEIRISDNGIGFDNKYLDKIFTIFQRLHGRTEYEGTGIGLAICRKVVENHNGIITADSQLSIGTIFYIVLPEKQEEYS